MIEQLNRLNRRFGANKFKIQAITPILNKGGVAVRFKINNFSEFQLTDSGVFEYVDGCFILTLRAQWLNRVANNIKRDDEGKPVAPVTSSGGSSAEEKV